ncbi:hypothetical protein AMTR_s00002p00270850 [Amborella trichopoda]|uniref:Uncharacterized protein n=1 Tax=Amborella trichopoda TaxID=13333 RepID=W1P0Q8_AMBTC|nr:hypothetical protein AMTR_s00002p00270850 [Amborella trichopoda]
MGSKERQSDKFKRVWGENSEMHAVNNSSNDLRTKSLIPLADMPRLKDAMYIALDSIRFFKTESGLHRIIGLIRTLLSNGANDFTIAALRTSCLASCVSA